MHIPFTLAHGQLLPSVMLIILVAGVSAIVCLMTAYRFELKKTPEGRRTARRLLVAVLVCVVVALLSPLIAQKLHLP